ncbi:MSC_0624 family F1-like ATPase-associated membrane protein [Mycoplasma sp. 2248]|uniref:MSC_0624 family F1-like ATPase-associated membrane protein n=1 Tax=Mycoplasma sp. 2248 TaxID=3108528 RepID=UPI002B1E42A6|nr:hypothetical protein [Mycoplasma sp. 2248]MEA4191173.1 hypothetical protein [Mycoplasma sp. 2248]
MQKSHSVNSKTNLLQLNWSKENVLKLISLVLSFLLISSIGIVFNYFINKGDQTGIDYSILFDRSFKINSSINFFVLFNLTLLSLLIIIAMTKSYFVINKNNLKFSSYIYWYVAYITYALITFGFYTFTFITTTKDTSAKWLIYNSFLLIPLLVIDLTFDVYTQVQKSRSFSINIKKLVLDWSYTIIKYVLLGIGLTMLVLMVNNVQVSKSKDGSIETQRIVGIFVNNVYINKLTRIFSENAVYKNLSIFGLVFALILLVSLKVYSNISNLSSVVYRNSLFASLTKLILAFILPAMFFAIYTLAKYAYKPIDISEDTTTKVTLFAVFISLVAILNGLVITSRFTKFKNQLLTNKTAFVILELVSLFVLLVANTQLNYFHRLIINLLFFVLFVINFGLVKYNKANKLNNLENAMLLAMLVSLTISLVFSIFLHATLSNDNWAMLVLTKNWDILTIFALVTIMLYILFALSSIAYTGFIKIFALFYEKRKHFTKRGK